MIIAIDFDGTLCEHEYPNIGPIKQDVFDAVVKAKKKGAQLILWTCRDGENLAEAVNWCKDKGLEFDAVNDNVPEYKGKEFSKKKIFADIYLDDRNVLLKEFVDEQV